MKIGYIGDSAYRAVIEHTNITLGINEDTEAVIVESALMEGPPDLPCLNTSQGIVALAASEDLTRNFNEIHNIVDTYPVTYLYGFMGEAGLSDMIEMTHATRFLTGDIGVQVGFCQGTGLKCTEDILMAIPDISELVDTLRTLEYRGEIKIGITDAYRICSVQFGHSTGGFALYTEISMGTAQENYEWCLGVGNGGRLHDNGVAVTTLLSYPPYPHSLDIGFSIKAPTGAEPHLYRVTQGAAEVAYVAAWGNDIFEASRRMRKTIDNCKAYNKDIQYRIDYGRKHNFVLSQDRWLQFGGSEPKHRR